MLPICPECKAGKHQNCDGVSDILELRNQKEWKIPCGCLEGEHPARPEDFEDI